ncbi:hypothetical protein BDW66DRAFT_140641 [Aspergillus desertorum]
MEATELPANRRNPTWPGPLFRLQHPKSVGMPHSCAGNHFLLGALIQCTADGVYCGWCRDTGSYISPPPLSLFLFLFSSFFCFSKP